MNKLTEHYRITDKYFFFWNTYYSQWHNNGKTYLFKDEEGNEFYSAEHYMMYHKAKVFNDTNTMQECLKAHSPKVVKGYGRNIPNFNDETWDKHKIDVVTKGNYLKFKQNKYLLDFMSKHKDLILVEASPYDKIWGIGKHFNDEDIIYESTWKGQNLLGVCLMNARDKLINEGII